MKKISVAILLAVFAVTAIAQNTTVVNDKDAVVRSVSGFHAVEVSHGIDLYISQGNTEAVAISAKNEKFRSNIKTVVTNGVLKIYYDDAGTMVHVNFDNRKLVAYVTVKNIDALRASGGSDVYVQGVLQSPDLRVELSGGSDLSGQLQAADFKINLDGGSDAKISGKSGSITVSASGGSDFKGYDFVTDNCNVDASGGSDIYITANKELTARASGGSDVYYKGSAVIKSTDASGGSDVKKKG